MDSPKDRVEQRALTKSASDPAAQRIARQVEKTNRWMELEDVRAVISTPNGRRFIWRLLQECHVFDSIWEPSARIHYWAGQQDIGHFLQREIEAAKPEVMWMMAKESREKEEADSQVVAKSATVKKEEEEHTDE